MGKSGLKTVQGGFGAMVLALTMLGAPAAQSLEKVPATPDASAVQSPLPPPVAGADQCGAADLAYLVGKPRSEIPVPIDPTRRRVYCTTCMVTQDYDPSRLDIVFDAQTGLIKQVKCG